MKLDLQAQFGTDDGEKDYGRAVADLIRAERHDLAEDTLIAGLASLRVPLAEMCLETRSDPVGLTNWDALQQMIFRPMPGGGLCTAVGLDLSNYGSPPQMTPGEWVEPGVEVAFYSDSVFAFSASGREEILAENASYPVAWHGCFEIVGSVVMHVVGLARLNSAVELDEARPYARPRPGQPGAPAPAGYVAFRLAEWLRALRYHRAVKRHLDREGLARRLPVIVGSHDVGPFLEAVYYPAPSRESAEEAEARMAAAREAQRRAWRAEKERKLWEAANSVREMRKAIRETRFWPSPQMRRLRDYYEAKEALVAQAHPLGLPPRPSWRIADDAEFERFLKRYYVDALLD